MTDHPCSQIEQITQIKSEVGFLKQNHIDVMDVIKEIKKDQKDGFDTVNKSIDEIKVYMFQGGMDAKYAKKTSVDRLWNMVWGVIAFFAIAVGGVLTSKLFSGG